MTSEMRSPLIASAFLRQHAARNEHKMTNPKDRDATLSKVRNLKMARSAHAYVRGSTIQFYEDAGGLAIPRWREP